MNKIINLKALSDNNLETYFLVITLFGYIFGYVDPYASDVIPHIFNLLIRGTVLLLSLYFIFRNFKIIKQRSWAVAIFLLFYFLYQIKAVCTFSNYYFVPDGFQILKNDFYYYGLIIIPLPVVALLSIDYEKINFKLFYKIIFWFLFIILGINFLHSVILVKLQKGAGIFRSYYILTGHYGLSLVLIGLYNFLFLKTKNYMYLLGILLGLFPMFISSARSPILALVIILLLFMILKNSKQYWMYFCSSLFISIIGLFIIYKSGFKNNILFFRRLNEAVFEGKASGRSYFLNKGIDEFTNNPWWGGRILFEDGTYAHNLFVDILMSTGLIGLFLFISYYVFVTKGFIKILKNIGTYKESGIIAFFFVQYFVLAQTSGSLYSSFELWYFSAAIIGLSYINFKNEKIKSNDSRGNATGNY
ncbi:O-antigen ligase-like membrane protein [Chryseobacterium sp. 52]|uniref:O-antigen ligase family protein n=1 Tax=Chryseobacterium sp. 52 TaxID=2035213 RepID=UPI000C177C87|nr:O-antigen ligase family protein [Chryseobacterium sp. 52]PIF47074.1 O-antigen ligase-like membrane protein [Chryseobacterium sp. 52]